MPYESVCAVKVFDYLHGFAVAAYAKPHEPLKYVFAFLRFVLSLYCAAILIIGEIFQSPV